MMDLLRLLVFCWLTGLAILAARALWRGNRSTLLVLMIGHWAFAGLPLLWDLLLGLPRYERFPNFARAVHDDTAILISLLYVAAIPVLVGLVALPWRRESAQKTVNSATDLGLPAPMLYVLLGLPVVMVLIAPRPEFYLQYGFIVDDSLFLPPDVLFHHGLLTVSCILAVAAAATLLSSRELLARQFFITFPSVFHDF